MDIRYHLPVSSDLNVDKLYNFLEDPDAGLIEKCLTKDFTITAGLLLIEANIHTETTHQLLELAWAFGNNSAIFALEFSEYIKTGDIKKLDTAAFTLNFGEAALTIASNHTANRRYSDAIRILIQVINRPQENHLKERAKGQLIRTHIEKGDHASALAVINNMNCDTRSCIDGYLMIGFSLTDKNIYDPVGIECLKKCLELARSDTDGNKYPIKSSAYRLALISKKDPEECGKYFMIAVREGLYTQAENGPVETRIRKAPNTFAGFISENRKYLHGSILKAFNANAKAYLTLREHYGDIFNKSVPVECCICLEESFPAAMNCSHDVCLDCYTTLQKSNSIYRKCCPLCRRVL